MSQTRRAGWHFLTLSLSSVAAIESTTCKKLDSRRRIGDREGKAHVIWEGQKYGPFQWAIPSPDGRYVALNLYVGETNAWMIENF